ncbi:flagellar basal body-associated FliL family protein [Arenibaculum pallidiluteum]|uniref:flagellar basal body-associated FliL family protein n=1 Tax=Arenibaculum pallidiluteum TaxID=2812559 RepID=UPI001A96CE64|nr:flagellar basal body-associated FliL family protein [Arenibaculum pallidiluteum]
MRALILLAGATAAAFAGGYGAGLLARPSNPGAPAPAGTAAEEASASVFVDAGQFAVPVMAGGRTTAIVLAQLTVEASGPAQAEVMRQRLPTLRDALLQALFGLSGSGFFEGPAVDPAAAAQVLQKAAEERIGPGNVRAVLFERLLRQDNRRG